MLESKAYCIAWQTARSVHNFGLASCTVFHVLYCFCWGDKVQLNMKVGVFCQFGLRSFIAQLGDKTLLGHVFDWRVSSRGMHGTRNKLSQQEWKYSQHGRNPGRKRDLEDVIKSAESAAPLGFAGERPSQAAVLTLPCKSQGGCASSRLDHDFQIPFGPGFPSSNPFVDPNSFKNNESRKHLAKT